MEFKTMTNFLEILEEEYDKLEDIDDIIEEWFFEGFDEAELLEMKDELTEEEFEELSESLKKHVSAKGVVTRRKSITVRSRRAVATTGMSKSALKRRARKAVRSKKRNPSGQRRATRLRKRANRIRKQRGLS